MLGNEPKPRPPPVKLAVRVVPPQLMPHFSAMGKGSDSGKLPHAGGSGPLPGSGPFSVVSGPPGPNSPRPRTPQPGMHPVPPGFAPRGAFPVQGSPYPPQSMSGPLDRGAEGEPTRAPDRHGYMSPTPLSLERNSLQAPPSRTSEDSKQRAPSETGVHHTENVQERYGSAPALGWRPHTPANDRDGPGSEEVEMSEPSTQPTDDTQQQHESEHEQPPPPPSVWQERNMSYPVAPGVPPREQRGAPLSHTTIAGPPRAASPVSENMGTENSRPPSAHGEWGEMRYSARQTQPGVMSSELHEVQMAGGYREARSHPLNEQQRSSRQESDYVPDRDSAYHSSTSSALLHAHSGSLNYQQSLSAPLRSRNPPSRPPPGYMQPVSDPRHPHDREDTRMSGNYDERPPPPREAGWSRAPPRMNEPTSYREFEGHPEWHNQRFPPRSATSDERHSGPLPPPSRVYETVHERRYSESAIALEPAVEVERRTEDTHRERYVGEGGIPPPGGGYARPPVGYAVYERERAYVDERVYFRHSTSVPGDEYGVYKEQSRWESSRDRYEQERAGWATSPSAPLHSPGAYSYHRAPRSGPIDKSDDYYDFGGPPPSRRPPVDDYYEFGGVRERGPPGGADDYYDFSGPRERKLGPGGVDDYYDFGGPPRRACTENYYQPPPPPPKDYYDFGEPAQPSYYGNRAGYAAPGLDRAGNVRGDAMETDSWEEDRYVALQRENVTWQAEEPHRPR
eukprot:comp19425_c0_seq1/m.22522 comp19425_c0_seq1/g.22522  ORF comp19425_c0_seq1/g.22522 comp19425_c0_seq1/m.22522 type:complete len:735 (-) comp19425_c0_seq1:473-2677(-)